MVVRTFPASDPHKYEPCPSSLGGGGWHDWHLDGMEYLSVSRAWVDMWGCQACGKTVRILTDPQDYPEGG